MDYAAARQVIVEFREICNAGQKAAYGTEAYDGIQTALYRQLPQFQKLARAIGAPSAQLHGGFSSSCVVLAKQADLAIGIIDTQAETAQIIGPTGPSLAASGLHAWAWNGAKDLWDVGKYRHAVQDAYQKVESMTRAIRRSPRSGKDLWSSLYSLDEPKPDQPRLRFTDVDRVEHPERWRSAHEGAGSLGRACAMLIRISAAHSSEPWSSEHSLEAIATISMLARSVDNCNLYVVP